MSRSTVSVKYEGGDRLRIRAGVHELLVDQPTDAGGDDSGPTPTELFVGSLVACMGFYAERFLRQNNVDPEGLELSADFELTTDRPYRVAAIDVGLRVPTSTPDRLLGALRRVVLGCSVHNSLREAPEVAVAVNTAAAV